MSTPSRIEYINAEWYYSAPFLSEFLLRFKYVPTTTIPTFGVGYNKIFILYYNEEFMEKLSNDELKGVLVHEIMHIIYIHTVRFMNSMKSADQSIAMQSHMDIYNYAADTCINERILRDLTVNGAKLSLPPDTWSLQHPLLKDYTGPLTTEHIYMYLLDKIPTIKLNVMCGGQGEQSLGTTENNEYSVNTFDDHSKLDELNSQEAKELGELIKHTAHVKGWGSMGGNMVGHIKELLAPKKVPLQEVLRKMLQMLADGYLVKYDTYGRMNRRDLELLPGKRKKGTIMNLVVDTSGSCFSEEDQKLFFSEIDYIANKVPNINLIQFDTSVTSHEKYKKGKWRSLKLKGSGGTYLQPLFDYLKQKKLNSYPTIIFTDGEFDWNINHYNILPLWVINNSSRKGTFGYTFVLRSEE